MAALVLSSCSNDQEIGNHEDRNNGENAINFRSFIDKGAASRATVTDGSNILGFTVTGWWEKTPTSTLPTATSDEYLFNAYDITRREAGMTMWDYAPKRFWPTTGGPVSFFAYSPASSKNVTAGLNNYKGTPIAYTVPDPAKNESQEDFLLANPGALSSGTVALNFAHVLSRVQFFAKTTNTDINYEIGAVEMINVSKKGTIDFTNIPTSGQFTYNNAAPIVAANTIQWTPVAGSKGNLSLDMGQSGVKLENQFKSILGETSALMVLPQTTTLGDTSTPATIAASIAGGNFLIKVSFKAELDGVYYAGSETSYEDKYFSVKDIYRSTQPHTFEIGRQYNFYLSFGTEAGNPIDFTVGVGNWDNNYSSVPLPQISNYVGIISNDLANAIDPAYAANGITYSQIVGKTSLTIDGAAGADAFKGIELFENVKSLTIKNSGVGLELNLLGTNVTELYLEKDGNISVLDISGITQNLVIAGRGTSPPSVTMTIGTLKVWDNFNTGSSGDHKLEMASYNSGSNGFVTVTTVSGVSSMVTTINVTSPGDRQYFK